MDIYNDSTGSSSISLFLHKIQSQWHFGNELKSAKHKSEIYVAVVEWMTEHVKVKTRHSIFIVLQTPPSRWLLTIFLTLFQFFDLMITIVTLWKNPNGKVVSVITIVLSWLADWRWARSMPYISNEISFSECHSMINCKKAVEIITTKWTMRWKI